MANIIFIFLKTGAILDSPSLSLCIVNASVIYKQACSYFSLATVCLYSSIMLHYKIYMLLHIIRYLRMLHYKLNMLPHIIRYLVTYVRI